MADIRVACSVFLAEVVRGQRGRVQRALVGIPIRGMRVGVVGTQCKAAASVVDHPEHRCLIGRIGFARVLVDLLIIRVAPSKLSGGVGRTAAGAAQRGYRSVERNRNLRSFDRAKAAVPALPDIGSCWRLVAHVVRNRLRRQTKIRVDGNRQPPPQAHHRARRHLHMPRKRFFHCRYRLVHLGIAEGRRELDCPRLDFAPRRSAQHIRKRRRASCAVLAIVGGPQEKLQVAVGAAGLRERRLQSCVFRAPKVHPVPCPQHRPVALRIPQSHADPRSPVIPQTGQLIGRRQIHVDCGRNRRRQLFPLPAHPPAHHQQLARLPLQRRECCPVVGAQVPVARSQCLRVIGIAWQISQPSHQVVRIAPYLPRRVAVVQVVRVQFPGEPKRGVRQRIRSKILDACIAVGARLVAQHAGCVGVVAQRKSAFHLQISPHPLHRFLRLPNALVWIAPRAESRRIPDGQTIARIHDNLRQLPPHVWRQKRLFKGRGRLGVRAENAAPPGSLRHRQKIGRKKRFPPPHQQRLAGLARPETVGPIRL